MNKLRIGVIGVGNMGSYHVRVLLEGRVAQAELTAIADVDADQVRRFPAVRGFADGAQLIRSGLVDAVLIATPHYNHTVTGIDALQQGRHVLVEKPISVHKADCERLLAAHTNPRQVFAAMLNQRTNPYYQKIRELVRGGQLGAVQRVNWTITDWFRTEAYYASSEWRATWAGEGGGVLLNQATHNLDLWQWMFGLPVTVRAVCGFGRYHGVEVEDDVTGLFEYATGATGVFVTTTGEAPGTNRLEVAGDRGRLVYEGDVLRFTQTDTPVSQFRRESPKHYELPARSDREFTYPNHGGQHLEILQNFVDAIRDGQPLIAPAREGIGAVELANAMIWSAARNAPVALPLDATGFAQHLNKLATSSRLRQPAGDKLHHEAAPYLVKEN